MKIGNKFNLERKLKQELEKKGNKRMGKKRNKERERGVELINSLY